MYLLFGNWCIVKIVEEKVMKLFWGKIRPNVIALSAMVFILAMLLLVLLAAFLYFTILPDNDWVTGAVFGGIVATIVNAFILALTGIVNTMGTVSVDPPPNPLLEYFKYHNNNKCLCGLNKEGGN